MRSVDFLLLPLITTCCSGPRREPMSSGTTGTVAIPAHAPSKPDASHERKRPEYWVERLSNREQRGEAVAWLSEAYEATLTKAQGNAAAPEVRALLDAIVSPLTQTYLRYYDETDVTTR